MSALCGHGQAEALLGAPFDLDTGSAPRSSGAGRKLAGTIRDLALIALAWTIFIGVVLHPGAQIVGIVVCGIALLAGSARAAINRPAEI